jgi:hypothetical protein
MAAAGGALLLLAIAAVWLRGCVALERDLSSSRRSRSARPPAVPVAAGTRDVAALPDLLHIARRNRP